MTAAGGNLRGSPLLVSPEAGAQIVLVDAADIVFADGGVDARLAREGSVDVEVPPTATLDPPAGGTLQVNLWQDNAAALAAERFAYWQLARGHCARISGVALSAAPAAPRTRKAA